MQMFVYLVLAVVIYGILAERLDHGTEREIRRRQSQGSDLRLMEEFDVRPDLRPRFGRPLHRKASRRDGLKSSSASR